MKFKIIIQDKKYLVQAVDAKTALAAIADVVNGNNMPPAIKGLLFYDDSITQYSGNFNDFSQGDFVCKIEDNIYIHYWTNGIIHELIMRKHPNGKDFCAFTADATSPNQLYIEYGLNDYKYSSCKQAINKAASEYFRRR